MKRPRMTGTSTSSKMTAAQESLLDLASMQVESGDYDGAKLTCRRLLRGGTLPSRKHAAAARYFGHACALSADYEAALDAYSESLSYNPERADVWVNRGQLNLYFGRTDDARADFDRALALGVAADTADYIHNLLALSLDDDLQLALLIA